MILLLLKLFILQLLLLDIISNFLGEIVFEYVIKCIQYNK